MSDKSFHILIVEDEIKIAEILSDYLSQAGFTVSHKDSGDGVVALVKSTPARSYFARCYVAREWTASKFAKKCVNFQLCLSS
jgi:CheY-like chemotaxis protein